MKASSTEFSQLLTVTNSNVRVRVRVTLRLTVSQSVCLGVEPRLGLMTRYLIRLKVTVLSIWGALSDERSGLSFVSQVKVKVKVTLRLTVSQSVSLGVEPHLELMTRYLVLFDSYGLVFFCGAPSLTRGRVCLLSESLPALVSHLL
jgi:hypothetical protein